MDAVVTTNAATPARSAAGRHVDVQHVWKAYTPGNYVVRDVSIMLQPGEFLTLLGPSGSGKTSTLMMVAGFETPNEGKILVDGRDVANLPPERRNFGVVFESQMLWLESLDSLRGHSVGVPMKPPAELRKLRGEEDTFWV